MVPEPFGSTLPVTVAPVRVTSRAAPEDGYVVRSISFPETRSSVAGIAASSTSGISAEHPALRPVP